MSDRKDQIRRRMAEQVKAMDAKAFLQRSRFSMAELIQQDFPPVEQVAEGIISAGLSILASAPKAGKSWLSLQLAVTAADGGRFLGSIPVSARPVMYLTLEDGPRRLLSRLKRMGYDKQTKKPVEFVTSAKDTDLMQVMRDFLNQHREEKPLIILDTLARFRMTLPVVKGETEYQADYRIAGSLQDLIAEYDGAALIVVHHVRKMGDSDFLQEISGSNGIAGAADSVLKLNRKRLESEGTVQITSRDAAEGEYKVAFDQNTGLWSLDGDNLNDAADAAREYRETSGVGDMMQQVVQFVGKHPTGISSPAGIRPYEVAEELPGFSSQTAAVYLKRAADAGRIRRTGRGLYLPNSTDQQGN
ncbi:AAA family ATPase [Bifidobacterium miconisargentati]|uniref:AAA family ATPase n=1 Tax=Bifidobacterium miconisargentati TaxID=2834437 RepID=UPI001BDC765B|nr:AAA family ATPase [Bifidobacterium miconisargentati]MBW3091324.1 AAA family ATPase [Bifidobacterium miconisargentati]